VIRADMCTKLHSSSSHDSGSLRFMPVVVFTFSVLLLDLVRSFWFRSVTGRLSLHFIIGCGGYTLDIEDRVT
jgi:hypothetical protein